MHLRDVVLLTTTLPLAIPGTVGAGTITTVIVQATTFTTPRDLLIITGVCVGTACSAGGSAACCRASRASPVSANPMTV